MTAPVAPRSGDSYRSQNGEERWLDAHFGAKRSGFFVEVGAYDGVNLSNTYHFEQSGWTGVLVEPDSDTAERCRRDRPRSRTFQCAANYLKHRAVRRLARTRQLALRAWRKHVLRRQP